jgi:hypothetical protein
MSCPKNLRTDLLTGANVGGTWSYLGYNACDPEGTPGAGGTAPGTLTGDNPEIDTDGWIVGYYFFEYEGGEGECADSVITVLQVLPRPCYPMPENVGFCVGQYAGDVNCLGFDHFAANESECNFNFPASYGSCDPNRNLEFYFDLSITEDVGSPDQLPPSWLAGFTCGVEEADLNDLPVGEYHIRIEVARKTSSHVGFTFDCTDCLDYSEVWVINVYESFDAGEAVKLAVCN